MQAAVARDLKRLLAFSTSENIGLILLGVGVRRACSPQPATRRGRRPGAGRGAAARRQPRRRSRRCCSSAPGRWSAPPAPATWTASAGWSARMPATTALFAVGALAARRRCRRATGSSPSGCCCSRCCTPAAGRHDGRDRRAGGGGGGRADRRASAVATFVKAVGTGSSPARAAAAAARRSSRHRQHAGRHGAWPPWPAWRSPSCRRRRCRP